VSQAPFIHEYSQYIMSQSHV